MNKNIIALLLIVILYSCNTEPPVTEPQPKEIAPPAVNLIDYKVVNTFKHDKTLFTEGLLVYNGQLYESTGSPEEMLYTKSLIGIHDLKTGVFSKKIEIDRSKYFGEGMTILNNKIYQLTYTNQIGFIYDAKTYRKLGEFSFANQQGWGLTTNGTELIMSDGTDTLTFMNPETLKPIKTIQVKDNEFSVDKLNELEYIKGYIYANIWTTNYIVKIDPSTGKVVGKLNLGMLYRKSKALYAPTEVLNGIAYDAATDKIYITGKLWPNMYEIEFPH